MESSIVSLTLICVVSTVILGVLIFLAGRKIFIKAQRPGWVVFVPLYNLLVFLDIIKKDRWWVFLFLIPVVNMVIILIVKVELARAFGRSIGFGLGLTFLPMIFYPVLGFGKSQYIF